MEQYISKSALVAEIESKKKCAQTLGDNAINGSMQQFYDGMKQGCIDILSSIDIIEAKEVDLEKEIREYLSTYWLNEKELHPFLGYMAKHFFELGLKMYKEK